MNESRRDKFVNRLIDCDRFSIVMKVDCQHFRFRFLFYCVSFYFYYKKNFYSVLVISASEMTCIVSSGALNSRLLTLLLCILCS